MKDIANKALSAGARTGAKTGKFVLKHCWALLVAAGVAYAGLLALPAGLMGHVPLVGNHFEDRDVSLGLDLRGGARLDFLVDLSAAEERIDADPQQILSGVREVLARRADPDGTRQLRIFSADFDGEPHILVELTADIDTPEMRARLREQIDLDFRRPREEPIEINAGDIAQNAAAARQTLAAAGLGTPAESIQIESAEFRSRNVRVSELPEDSPLAAALAGTAAGSVLSVENSGEYELVGHSIAERRGTTAARVVAVREATDEREVPGESLDAVAPSGVEAAVPVLDLEESARNELLGSTAPGTVSAPIAVEGGFALFELISAEQEGGALSARAARFATRAEAEGAFARTQPVSETYTVTEHVLEEWFFRLEVDNWESTGLGGANFRFARVGTDHSGLPVVLVEFDEEGAERFADLTEELVGQPMAIFVGGELISAPIIREKITGGAAQISLGERNFSAARVEAARLARDLNAGAIPAPVSFVGEERVSPTLGENALGTVITAGALGLLLVAALFVAVYRLAGALAAGALLVYAALLVAAMKLFPLFVLTLPGAAGLLLSVGLAVDANVLIFERIREEIRNGRSVTSAVDLGFARAIGAIRDANLTTLLACVALFLFGPDMVKSFGAMLALGVVLSVFTAVYVTRFLLVHASLRRGISARVMLGA